MQHLWLQRWILIEPALYLLGRTQSRQEPAGALAASRENLRRQ